MGILLVVLVGASVFYEQYYVAHNAGHSHVPGNIMIYIVAEQWAFMLNGTIDTRNTPVVVHVGEHVTFHVHATFQQDPSFDEHGFFIQGLMEAPVAVSAWQDITVTIVPTQAGKYTIVCTIFCGAGHLDMYGFLEVLA